MLTGRCADIYGRYRFFIAGLLIFTIASFLGGLSPNGAVLIAMRGLQGLGAALVNPGALAIVLSMFPAGPARSRAVALWGTIGSTGIAAGMLFGGVLVQYFGWRSVLYVNVPFAVVVLALASSHLPHDTLRSARTKLDAPGAALLTATLVTFVYTIESIPAGGIGSPRTIFGIVSRSRCSRPSSPSSGAPRSRSSRRTSSAIPICSPAPRSCCCSRCRMRASWSFLRSTCSRSRATTHCRRAWRFCRRRS